MKDVIHKSRIEPYVMAGLTLLFLLPVPAHAGWIKTYGNGEGWSVLQSADGGYIAVGERGAAFGNLWIIKTDPDGDTLWTRTYGDTTEMVGDEGRCIRRVGETGYIVLSNTATGFAEPGEQDGLWLYRLDDQGYIVWSRRYEGIGLGVAPTDDGGFIVTGDTRYPYLPEGLLVLRVDEYGNTLWRSIFGEGENLPRGFSVQQTFDGNFIVTGFVYRERRQWDIWLLKIDDEGDTLWTHSYGTLNSDDGMCVQQTTDGGFIVTGTMDLGWLGLLRTDENGDSLWLKKYRDEGAVLHDGYYVQQTTDGGYIAVGVAWMYPSPLTGQVFLVKTDSLGNEMWLKTYGGGGQDVGTCVQQTSDGGYIISTIYKLQDDHYDNFGLIKTNDKGDTVGIAEPRVSVTALDWEITPIGRDLVLRYRNRPNGFHAEIFDASGRKIDELRGPRDSGTIKWGETLEPGVYFIRALSEEGAAVRKFILIPR
ncbi:T9SS type A sorting domain-containing protein [candidate division WOR-3 bacterium]|nr:T9SS type A sorting domain-containing protein [candidate division WOR-3 bacterium]